MQQDDLIQTMLRKSILKLLGDLLFEDSFPDAEERTRMSRDAVVYAGREMKFDEVVHRLMNDVNYLNQLAKVVSRSCPCDNHDCSDLLQAENRISQYRGAIKKSSALHVIEAFGSLRGKPNKVKALLDRKAYIYPFKNGKVRTVLIPRLCGLICSQPQRHKPYGNTIFPAILRDTIFKRPRAIGYKLKDRLFSSIKGTEHQPEVPPSMMSFLGTTVCIFSLLIRSLTLFFSGTRRDCGVGDWCESYKALHLRLWGRYLCVTHGVH